MTRRTIGLLVILALGLLVAPLAVEAQQSAGKMPRIGFLATASSTRPAASLPKWASTTVSQTGRPDDTDSP
jgi:hypothetical protein